MDIHQEKARADRAEAALADCERHEDCYGPEKVRELDAALLAIKKERDAMRSEREGDLPDALDSDCPESRRIAHRCIDAEYEARCLAEKVLALRRGECQCGPIEFEGEQCHEMHCPEMASRLHRGYCDRIKELLAQAEAMKAVVEAAVEMRDAERNLGSKNECTYKIEDSLRASVARRKFRESLTRYGESGGK